MSSSLVRHLLGLQVLSHVSFALTGHYPRTKKHWLLLYDALRGMDAWGHYYFAMIRSNTQMARYCHAVAFVQHLAKFCVDDSHAMRVVGRYVGCLEALLYIHSYFKCCYDEASIPFLLLNYGLLRVTGLAW